MLRMLRSEVLPFLQAQFTTNYTKCLSKPSFEMIQSRLYSSDFDVNSWLTTLDEAQQKRIRFIQNELTLKRLENQLVPKLEDLTKNDYEHVLGLSQNQRLKYYAYLFKTHNSEKTELMKRDIRKIVLEAKKEAGFLDQDCNHIEYGLGKGALIPKIYNRTIDKWKNRKALRRIMVDDPKIIFDCGYTDEMTHRENLEASKQLSYCFALNRNHQVPFVLHFTGMNYQKKLWRNLKRIIPTLSEKPLPVRIHEEDVIDVFPKEKLVLLTPDSPNMLKEYNPDDHYVISAIVDRGDRVPYTLSKAKKYDLRTARLPLEAYRTCRINKTLTLDQVLQVMLEIKYSRDWNEAFRYVASRKFY